jgi:hypothetical protein
MNVMIVDNAFGDVQATNVDGHVVRLQIRREGERARERERNKQKALICVCGVFCGVCVVADCALNYCVRVLSDCVKIVLLKVV